MKYYALVTMATLVVTSLLTHVAQTDGRSALRSVLSDEPHRSRPAGSLSRPTNTNSFNIADTFLVKYGYLPKPQPGAFQSISVRNEGISNFQRMVGLPVTGTIDQQTLVKMAAPRCGMADMVPMGQLPEQLNVSPRERSKAAPTQHIAQNFYAPGVKWSKDRLTWKANSYSPDLSQDSQRRAFYQAFRMWSDVVPLHFPEVARGTPADINIEFVLGEHSDGSWNAFDGLGGVLAHAYYPESGNTHFDDAEHWTEYSTQGTNLMIVAAHEFGHVLGLGHSNVSDSLMAPYYQGYIPNFKLHSDDIAAAQSLYGRQLPTTTTQAPTTTEPPRPRPTPRVTTTPMTTTLRPTRKPQKGIPETCNFSFDAVMQGLDQKIYIFRQKWLWKVDEYSGLEEGFPKRITKVFAGAPYGIAAAVVSWRTRYTYFFKGNRIWKYYGFYKVQKKTIRTSDYPRDIMSAFMSRDGKIYLLSRDKYWIFDEYTMDLYERTSRPISTIWPGIPPAIEAAVRLRDGYVYFFKGSKYRKYNEQSGQVLPGYPKEKAAPWFGQVCSAGAQPMPRR